MSPGWLLQNIFCFIILGFGEYGNHIRVAAQCKQPTPDGRSRLSVVKSSYAANEVVGVLCIPGYRPQVKEITCKKVFFSFRWSNTPQCIAQCKKPIPAGRSSLSVEKDYYEVGEVVIVYCNSGYQPRVKKITCRWPESGDQWDPTPQCVAEQCNKPKNTGNYTLSGSGNFYDMGQYVTVRCSTGYRPLYERIRCVAPGSRSEWDTDPLCIAQCKKPYPDGRYSLSVEKEYYDVDEVVTVRCNEGYETRVNEIRCRSQGSAGQWDRTPRCRAQCKKLENTGNYTLSGSGKFYDVGQSVTVQCRTGYRPLYQTIRCFAPGRTFEWNKEPLCIAQCKKPENTGNYTLSGSRKLYDAGQSVTVQCRTGYRPLYETIKCVAPGSTFEWNKEPLCIAQCKKPNSDGSYSLSIEKEYYDVDEEVTVQCNEGHQPQVKRITCRSWGSAVYWDWTPQCIDVSGTSNSTRSFIVSLDLPSMLWLIVPIATVKLLVLVVLLKIQFTLISGKTSETDQVKHDERIQYRILYRKGEEDFVSIQNATDDHVYSNPKEAALS